ncbi:unnamed protein product [Rodentolepis nana]|uniref:F-box domain-containing protein n=1 Tax=Rodentolepis nana TaxID=102285 RepID=A0A0R3TMF4_RODNA|nr:unnamed protein product [Rodentolepis nana]
MQTTTGFGEMVMKKAQLNRLRIKKLSDLTADQRYYLRSFLPPMLEIAAPYVIDNWTETFDVSSYAASVCRNWKWLDAKLVSLLLPYPQDRCINACYYMYDTSLRVTTFRNIKMEGLENAAVVFDVLAICNRSTSNKTEVVRLKEPPISSANSEVENKLFVLILFANYPKELSGYLNEHGDELGTKYKVVVFLVPCNCEGPTIYNMDCLMLMYSRLSSKTRKDLMEKKFKWRFWLVHNHEGSLLNVNDPINWAFGECVATLKENDASSEESLS